MHEASIRLTAEERRELQSVSKSERETGRTRTRAMVVLLSDAGESATRIARVVGVSVRTVRDVRNRWRRRAFGGLMDAPRSGRPPRAGADYIRILMAAVQRDPRKLGFAFTRWTAPRLVEYLRGRTGVRVTPEWLTELLRTHGFVWRRTKRTTRNLQDPVAVARAHRRLRRLKRGPWSAARPTSSGSGTGLASISSPW
jgi:transposase